MNFFSFKKYKNKILSAELTTVLTNSKDVFIKSKIKHIQTSDINCVTIQIIINRTNIPSVQT